MPILTPLTQSILDGRMSREEQLDFITVNGSKLPSHTSLAGYKEKVLSWLSKLDKSKPVLIFGDYDVDGLFSTSYAAILLRALGYTPVPFIPCRFEDGYGFQLKTLAVNNLLGHSQMLILDSGTNEYEKAQYLPATLLIIDHHSPAKQITGDKLVNPHFDFKGAGDFCTCSLLYLFNQILAEQHPIMKAYLPLGMCLGAIGTMADQCKLIAHNRVLVSMGVALLNQRLPLNDGLSALVEALCGETFTESDVVWKVCPTINAAGRLGKPEIVLDLLIKAQGSATHLLVQQLVDLNAQRKEITKRAIDTARVQAAAQLQELPPKRILCVFNKDWHPGIVGIVAGSIAETFQRPCFAFTYSEHGLWEGSGRSYDNINILACAQKVKATVSTMGGHAQAMGIKVINIELFSAAINALPVFERDVQAHISYDPIVITTAEATVENITNLNILRPFGSMNEEPEFCIEAKCATTYPAKSGISGKLQDQFGQLRFYCSESLLPKLKAAPATATIKFIGNLNYQAPYSPALMLHDLIVL
jgi:single-stranded-DNA-specific exonuclease